MNSESVSSGGSVHFSASRNWSRARRARQQTAIGTTTRVVLTSHFGPRLRRTNEASLNSCQVATVMRSLDSKKYGFFQRYATNRLLPKLLLLFFLSSRGFGETKGTHGGLIVPSVLDSLLQRLSLRLLTGSSSECKTSSATFSAALNKNACC